MAEQSSDYVLMHTEDVDIACTVDDCGWRYVHTAPDVPADALASVFGFGVMSSVAINTLAETIERGLRDHMSTHTAADFLRTITRLRARVAELESTTT